MDAALALAAGLSDRETPEGQAEDSLTAKPVAPPRDSVTPDTPDTPGAGESLSESALDVPPMGWTPWYNVDKVAAWLEMETVHKPMLERDRLRKRRISATPQQQRCQNMSDVQKFRRHG